MYSWVSVENAGRMPRDLIFAVGSCAAGMGTSPLQPTVVGPNEQQVSAVMSVSWFVGIGENLGHRSGQREARR